MNKISHHSVISKIEYHRRCLRLFVLISLLFYGGDATAAAGTISQIDTIANEPNNYEIRIYLGGIQMCTTSGPSTYAYLNSADNNFNATYASLMMAYSTGKNIVIFTLNDAGIGCHIHYVMNH